MADQPRAPAASEKLQIAEAVRADLEQEVAALALDASEGKAGAEKALSAHRGRIDTAERQVAELRAAVSLAERLDREADVAAAAHMRKQQLAVFVGEMATCEKEMATVLETSAAMAAAYARYSEAVFAAQIAAPSGTAIPTIMIGPNGLYGPAFGPCQLLILSEMYRLAPDRSDGLGRFVLPFSRPATADVRFNPGAIPPGLDEFKAATRVIIADIETQVATLNASAMEAASAVQEAA